MNTETALRQASENPNFPKWLRDACITATAEMERLARLAATNFSVAVNVQERVDEVTQALRALADAADAVGVAHFDGDDLSAEAHAMQAATLRAREVLAALTPNVELTGPTRRDGLARTAETQQVPRTRPSRPAVAGPVERRVGQAVLGRRAGKRICVRRYH